MHTIHCYKAKTEHFCFNVTSGSESKADMYYTRCTLRMVSSTDGLSLWMCSSVFCSGLVSRQGVGSKVPISLITLF